MLNLLEGPVAPTSVTAELKERTTHHHRDAERSPFQQALVRGTLPLQLYVRWLAQMSHLHATLEVSLTTLTDLAVEPYRHTADLAKDLAYFQFDITAAPPLASVRSFGVRLAAQQATNPVGLLGALYVLEGSMNGGRFIARAVRRAYGLSVDGCRYLDPYAEAQPTRWLAFKSQLDEYLAARNHAGCAAMAEMTFESVTRLGAELLGTSPCET